MIAAYTITISRTTAVSQCTSAYKIFFIILELIKQFISSPPFYPLKNCRYRLYDDIGILLSVSPVPFVSALIHPIRLSGYGIFFRKTNRARILGKAISPFQISDSSQTAVRLLTHPRNMAYPYRIR